MKKPKWTAALFSLICILLLSLVIPNAFARRGCCSHHGSVAGCDTSVGSLICRDGSYSPTCGCTFRPPQKQQKKKGIPDSSDVDLNDQNE
jgi:hypothetical protein